MRDVVGFCQIRRPLITVVLGVVVLGINYKVLGRDLAVSEISDRAQGRV